MLSRSSSIPIRVLVVDNLDSFTYNLVQLAESITDIKPIVILNSTPWKFVLTLLDEIDAIIISPGPGSPDRQDDFGICKNLLLHSPCKPILGICLGLQGLAHIYGSRVVRASEPIHGRTSPIKHIDSVLFQDIPQDFKAVRYNSLVVDPSSVGSSLKVTAWTEDESGNIHEIMGLDHVDRPIYSVQFHPESVASEYGEDLLRNFFKHCPVPQSPVFLEQPINIEERAESHENPWKVLISELPWIESQVYYQSACQDCETSVWLDSSLNCGNSSVGGRFSYIAGHQSGHSQRYKFYLHDRSLFIDKCKVVLPQDCSFFDFMKQVMGEPSLTTTMLDGITSSDIEFPFVGGLVGYFSYEMQNECCLYSQDDSNFFKVTDPCSPDACFVFVDRLIVFDHQSNRLFGVAIQRNESCNALEWFEEQRILIKKNSKVSTATARPAEAVLMENIDVKYRESQSTYEKYVKQCIDHIYEGESYELCLTTKATFQSKKSPLELYSSLRKHNPAPYSAFLSFRDIELYVCCSSPERFLHITPEGLVQCKPIKGTCRRSNDPDEDVKLQNELENSIKDRSENLMIVDLIRNDFGRVCKKNTVHVPKLMKVESFETVHHLVSTVQGFLSDDKCSIDCFRNAFPPGSMTGAPKYRSMQILAEIERHPRGIYSGSIGFFSLNGASDFNVVIRTAVSSSDGEWSIGCGGAIVCLSDPHEEYSEMILKSKSVLGSIVMA